MDPTVAHLIESLRLEPHPEGGYYREFFRSDLTVTPADGRGARAALTAIYFLLPADSFSRWHVIGADEQWTHLDGDPIELLVVEPGSGALVTHRLGHAHEGYEGVAVVPRGAWQAARPSRGFCLVTCTTGPGFDFADFRLLDDDTNASARIRTEWPHLADLL